MHSRKAGGGGQARNHQEMGSGGRGVAGVERGHSGWTWFRAPRSGPADVEGQPAFPLVGKPVAPKPDTLL